MVNPLLFVDDAVVIYNRSQQAKENLPEDQLMDGALYQRTGRTGPRRPSYNEMRYSGQPTGASATAFSGMRMRQGETLPALAGGIGSYPIFWGAARAALSYGIPAAPAAVSSFLALGLAVIPAYYTARGVTRGIRTMNAATRSLRRLEMGGHYEDSDTAEAFRMMAVNEMSGTMGGSRRFLGREALFMRD